MMGSIAIDAWVSQYASVCSRGVSLLQLSAASCMKPVEPARSTSVLWRSAPALSAAAGVPLVPQLTRSTAAAAQLTPHPKRNGFNLPSLFLESAFALSAQLAMPYRIPRALGQCRFLHEARQIFGSIHVIP